MNAPAHAPKKAHESGEHAIVPRDPAAVRLLARQLHIDFAPEESTDVLRQRIHDTLRPGVNGFSQYP